MIIIIDRIVSCGTLSFVLHYFSSGESNLNTTTKLLPERLLPNGLCASRIAEPVVVSVL